MFSWCLVAFQKIFRKIFSGVWKRKRKTQIQKNTSHNPDHAVRRPHRRSRSEIAIDGAISRRRDRDLREIAIDGAISRSVNGDLDPVRSREGKIAISIQSQGSVRSRSRSGHEIRCDRDLDPVARSGAITIRCDCDRVRALSLSLSHFPEIL